MLAKIPSITKPMKLHQKTPLYKRAILLSVDIVFIITLTMCAWLSLTVPAQAYVDPSVMTYAIQALAGVAVALSAVIGVAWRRIRRLLYKMLMLDDNANKNFEPAVADLSADSNEDLLSNASAEAVKERSKQGIEQTLNIPWRSRLILSFIAVFALLFTQLVAAPLEIIATNISAFQFSFSSVAIFLAIACIVGIVALSLLMSLLKGKVFDVTFSLLIAIVLAALIQAIFLNVSLPATDGSSVVWWGEHKKIYTISTFVWIVILGGGIWWSFKKPLASKGPLIVLAFLLTLTSAINLGVTVNQYKGGFDTPKYTKEGLYTVSSNKNLIIFVLDFFDTTTMDQILETPEYANVLDDFNGFTYFHNCTAATIPTRHALPFLTTGNLYDTSSDEVVTTNGEKVKSTFYEHMLLDDANAQNYSVGIYTNYIDGYGSENEEAPLVKDTINIHSIDPELNDPVSVLKMLLKCTLYRNAPWILKPYMRYYTGDINDAVVSDDSTDSYNTPYVMNDPNYYSELKSTGISVEESEKNGYRLIHLMGAHSPYVMDENGNAIEEATGLSDEERVEARNNQAVGALGIVNEYINQLKELNLYDDATIIVTADHGNYWWAEIPEKTSTPLLMVKSANADSSASWTQSEAPVSQFDLVTTIREEIGIEQDEPTLFEIDEDSTRKRYFYWNEQDATPAAEGGTHADIGFHEIEIDGDALDINNWHPTGRFWKNGN